jgi:hypothetical protein
MTRTLRVAQAKQADVVRVVREALAERGARLHEMTHSRTTFDRLAGPGAFARGGYCGVYQPMGEPDADVLLQVWATGPRRAYWGMAALSVAAVLALIAASPPSAVFFLAALVLWPLFGVSALLYVLTFRGSEQVEDELAALLRERVAARGGRVLREEELLERSIRERLEGEAKEREVQARRAAQPRERRRFRGAPKEKPARPAKRAERPPKEKRALFGSRK